jgi:hypothetical protein
MPSIEQYSPAAAHALVRAYADGVVDSSIDVLAHEEMRSLLPDDRRYTREAFTDDLSHASLHLHDVAPHLVLAVGGMASGKSTYIESLDAGRYLKPVGYRDYLPEHRALTETGRHQVMDRHREDGRYASDHASRFIQQERLMLKRDALAVAALQGCSVAIESHPVIQDIGSLQTAALRAGLEVRIVGFMATDVRIAQARAEERAARSGRTVSAAKVAATAHLMQELWPDISAMADSELIRS